MAAPFDANAVTIYGKFSQFELLSSGSSQPEASASVLRMFASGNGKLYYMPSGVSGSAPKEIATSAGGLDYSLTDGDGIADFTYNGSAAASISVDITNATELPTVDDVDTILIDAGDGGTVRKITRANYLGSALASLDAGIDVNGANFTVSTAGAVVAASLNNSSGGITNAGSIAGATTIAASSTVTAEGDVSGAAGTFDALGGTSLALQSGGITAAGAIAGATTLAMGGALTGATTIAASSTVTAEGAVSGAAGTFDALAGTSLALQSGGITAAGTVAGVSGLTATANLDIGAYDLRAATLTADGLTATRVVFAGANGVLSDDSDMTFSDDTLTVTKLGAFEAAGSIDFSDEAMTNVNIDSGAIDGVTIGTNSAATQVVVTQLTASSLKVSSNLTIVGDLQVQGNLDSVTVTQNTLEVSDYLIIAGASGSAANMDGGGLQFGGSDLDNNEAASVLWDNSNGALDFNIGTTTQVRLADGVFRPETDSDVTLGASGGAFSTLYVDAIDLNGQGSISMGGTGRIDLDADDDTSIRASADDVITFEVAGTDQIQMSANLLAPSTADGAALGGASNEWSDLYLADSGIAYFGNDQDVTLTHVADTGLLLNSTRKIQFNDASQYIGASSAADLDLAATTDINMDCTTVDVNAALDVSGATTLNGSVTVNDDFTVTGAAGFAAVVATSVSSSGAVSAGEGSSFVIGSADMSEADLEKLDGITNGYAAAGKSVVLDSSRDVVNVNSIYFGGNNGSDGNYIGSDGSDRLTLKGGASAQMRISTLTTGSTAMLLQNDAAAGGIYINAGTNGLAGAATGKIKWTSTSNATEAIKLHADAGTNQTISLTNDEGTRADAITLHAAAGGIDVNAAGTVDIYSSAGSVKLSGSAGSGIYTSAGAVTLDGKTGFSMKENGTEVFACDTSRNMTFGTQDVSSLTMNINGAIDIDANGTLAIDSASTMSISTANSGVAVNIGHSTSETTVGDNFTVSGDCAVTGDTTLNGDVTLGNATGDDITVTGRLAADLAPKTDSAYDLGTSALQFQTVFTDQVGSHTQALDLSSSLGVSISGTKNDDGYMLELPPTGDARARAWVTYSSARHKTNVHTLENPVQTLKQLRGVSYDWKGTGQNDVGFIAEEVGAIVPEVVSFGKDGRAEGIDYGRLTSVLVEAMKQQQSEIEKLQSVVHNLTTEQPSLLEDKQSNYYFYSCRGIFPRQVYAGRDTTLPVFYFLLFIKSRI